MKEVVREKERFFSSAYHDIQQPLAAINLFIRSARTRLRDEHAANHDLDVIEETARTSSTCSRTFRTIANWAHTFRTWRQSIRMTVFTEVFEQYREPARFRGIEFRISERRRPLRPLKLTAPCSSGPCPILYRMRSRTPHRAESWSAGCSLMNGCASMYGIPESASAPAHREAIFAEYYQINNPGRDRSKGLGLGLSIVNRVVGILPKHSMSFGRSKGADHVFPCTRRYRKSYLSSRRTIRTE